MITKAFGLHQTLNVAGNTVAINKLSESLANFFDEDSEIKEYFQLDYYKGSVKRHIIHPRCFIE